MDYSTILFSEKEGVARLTLNRPEQLNAFNLRMHAEVNDALDRLIANPNARVLLLTGEGKGFCAGQDLQERKRGPDDPPHDLGDSIEQRYAPLARRLMELPLPIVCAVNGVAAGAGANLALCCDIVVAKMSARFIQSFVKIGLIPDCGGTWSLTRAIGRARAIGAAMLGEPLGAAQAEAWGLIWRAIPDEIFEAEVEALAGSLARGPTRAYAAIKQSVLAADRQGFSDQLDIERDLQRGLGFTEDYAEGVRAFSEKRPPEFRGQ